METRELNVSFYKAGNGTASRLNVPITWLRKLGITQETKEILLMLDEEKNQIIIKKR